MAGQLWAVSTIGGYQYSLELSDLLRTAVQPLVKFRQFCDAKDFTNKGVHGGQLFTWNVYNDVANTGTTLVETNTMAETNYTIAQGTGTVLEMGNSVPYTEFLNNMSKHPVQEIINKVMKNDCKRAMDGQAWRQFDLTPLRVVPAGSGTSTTALTLTTNGTATGTNTIAFGKTHARLIADTMKERNIPPYDGDEYFGIAWVSTWRQLKNDLESVYQYRDSGLQMIINGEIGKYEGIRFVEQTDIPKGRYNSGNYITGSFTTWSTALSDWAFFFGQDTVAEAIVIPEEIRGKIPGDFGRSRGIAWYYEGGFALTQTQAAQARIVKWDSAA